MITKEYIDLGDNQSLTVFIDLYNREIHDLTAQNMSKELDLIMRNISHTNLNTAIKCLHCHAFEYKYSKEIIDILTRYL